MNSVFFSNTIYGESFGPNVLAVTMNYSGPGSTFAETDVIFNNTQRWNSYRGPLQFVPPIQAFDFHRVALHEFGHVLGLGHPDQQGQGVYALMNSNITDFDHLLPDDIAGARWLYGARITRTLNPPGIRSGEQFSYQISANNRPSSYSAVGLPPGLQLNSVTGLITGKPSSSGTFVVDVMAPGALGTATGKIWIGITPLPLTSGVSPPAVLIGDNFSYQVTAGNNPTIFSAIGLPAGLRIDPRTGVISGAAAQSGAFNVTVKASGPTSEASGIVRIVISPPRITSALSLPEVDIGSNFTYQIAADHRPTSFTATGLPAVLRIDPVTGRITEFRR